MSDPATKAEWMTSVRALCAKHGITSLSETDMMNMVEGAMLRGKSLRELEQAMVKRLGSSSSSTPSPALRQSPSPVGPSTPVAGSPTDPQYPVWHHKLKTYLNSVSNPHTDDAIHTLMRDTTAKGKTYQQLYDKLVEKHSGPTLHSSTMPPPLDAQTAQNSANEAAMRRHWHECIKLTLISAGAPQSDEGISAMMTEAAQRGKSYEELHAKLEAKYRGNASGGGGEGLHGKEVATPPPPSSPFYHQQPATPTGRSVSFSRLDSVGAAGGPMPEDKLSDRHLWRRKLLEYVAQHPKLAESHKVEHLPPGVKASEVTVITAKHIDVMLDECEQRGRSGKTLYDRFVKKFGAAPSVSPGESFTPTGASSPSPAAIIATSPKKSALRAAQAASLANRPSLHPMDEVAGPTESHRNFGSTSSLQRSNSTSGGVGHFDSGSSLHQLSSIGAAATAAGGSSVAAAAEPPASIPQPTSAAPKPTPLVPPELYDEKKSSVIQGEYLDRIRRFSDHYKLAQSDNDIEKMMHDTLRRRQPLESLMERLVKKFGPEPENPRTVELMKLAEKQRFKTRIMRLLIHHNADPDPDAVDAMLLKAEMKGTSNDKLMSKLVAKYGPEPLGDEAGAAEAVLAATNNAAAATQPLLLHNNNVFTAAPQSQPQVQQPPGSFYGASITDQQRRPPSPSVGVRSPSPTTFKQPPPGGPSPLAESRMAGLTKRQQAEQRLVNFSRFYNWQRSHQDLIDMLDEAEFKHNDKDFTQLFFRLERIFGPEPPMGVVGTAKDIGSTQALSQQQQPGGDLRDFEPLPRDLERGGSISGAGIRPAANLGPENLAVQGQEIVTKQQLQQRRMMAKERLIKYCHFYRIKKTDRDYEQVLDDYAEVGWDRMFENLEKKFGPLPWKKDEEYQSLYSVLSQRGAPATSLTHSSVVQQPKGSLTSFTQNNSIQQSARGPSVSSVSRPGGGGLVNTQRDASPVARQPIEVDGRLAVRPTMLAEISNSQKHNTLSLFNTVYNIGWTDSEITAMLNTLEETERRRGGIGFVDLVNSLELKYGPLPQHEAYSVRSSSVGVPPPSGPKSGADLLGEMGVHVNNNPQDNQSLLGLAPQSSRGGGGTGINNREKIQDEKEFWAQRIMKLLRHYRPGDDNTTIHDVYGMMTFYGNHHQGYLKLWEKLIEQYGPEPALTHDEQQQHGGGSERHEDPVRHYWKMKFKHYCKFYNIHKTERDLDQMLDDYKDRGWSVMYDKLCDVHGPPPPTPVVPQAETRAQNNPPPQGMLQYTPAQWKERVLTYCAKKFPTKTKQEIQLYVDQYEASMPPGSSMEQLYATLVLLHGFDKTEGGGDGDRTTNINTSTTHKDPREIGLAAAAAGEGNQPFGAVPPPTLSFVTIKATIRFGGMDYGLYHLANPAVKSRFCTALETQVANALDIGENRVELSSLTSRGVEVVADFIIKPFDPKTMSMPSSASAPAVQDPRELGDQLVRKVTSGTFPVSIIARSYLEDLGGNPLLIKPMTAAMVEIRGTPDYNPYGQSDAPPTPQATTSTVVAAAGNANFEQQSATMSAAVGGPVVNSQPPLQGWMSQPFSPLGKTANPLNQFPAPQDFATQAPPPAKQTVGQGVFRQSVKHRRSSSQDFQQTGGADVGGSDLGDALTPSQQSAASSTASGVRPFYEITRNAQGAAPATPTPTRYGTGDSAPVHAAAPSSQQLGTSSLLPPYVPLDSAKSFSHYGTNANHNPLLLSGGNGGANNGLQSAEDNVGIAHGLSAGIQNATAPADQKARHQATQQRLDNPLLFAATNGGGQPVVEGSNENVFSTPSATNRGGGGDTTPTSGNVGVRAPSPLGAAAYRLRQQRLQHGTPSW